MRGLCAEPGCPAPPVYRGRCKAHARAEDKQIRRVGRTIYNTKRWKLARRHVLFEQGLCQADGCNEIATDVDHVIPLANGGSPYSRDNLQALCGTHHSRKTRAEQTSGVGYGS